MPQPFNYGSNIPNPSQAILEGVQLATGIAQNKQVRAEAAAAQTAVDRRTAFQNALLKIQEKPSSAAIASLGLAFPEFGAVIKEAHDVLGAEEQKQNITDASSVYSALIAGEPEYAAESLRKQAEALRNGGREQDAKAREDLAKLVELSPETALTTGGLYLSKVMGGDFAKNFSGVENERRQRDLEGAALTKAEAEAASAAVAADFAQSNAALDLQKKGFDIEKIKNDIEVSRANLRIAALNADLKKEGNEQRKALLQSKLSDAQLKRDATVRERVANAESARGAIDNFLNTADRALKTKDFVVANATGPVDQRFPTLFQSTADFEADIETLRSQTFLAQVPNLKGLGQLSDAEGKKLDASLANLSLKQSPERLLNNIREAQRLLLKARENITTRYGVPETIPDTPNAAPEDPELQSLLDQYLFEGDDGNP